MREFGFLTHIILIYFFEFYKPKINLGYVRTFVDQFGGRCNNFLLCFVDCLTVSIKKWFCCILFKDFPCKKNRRFICLLKKDFCEASDAQAFLILIIYYLEKLISFVSRDMKRSF